MNDPVSCLLRSAAKWEGLAAWYVRHGMPDHARSASAEAAELFAKAEALAEEYGS